MSRSPAEGPRVLLASDFFVRYMSGLASGLLDQGAGAVLLTRDHDQEFGGRPGAMRAHVKETLGDRVPHLELTGRLREPAGLRAAWDVRRRLKAYGFNALHFQEGAANDPRIVAVAGARPRRYALTIHDAVLHPGDPTRKTNVQKARDMLVRYAGVIFVHAEALREELREVERPRAPIEVIPHGVEESLFSPLPETPTLLFFGRLSYYKGLDTLLDAMPAVWERVPEARLVVAGHGELPEHSVLSDPRIVLRHEHVADEEVPSLFESATCVVLPYRQASQSGVGSLAKRYGRALVSTKVGGLPELVSADVGTLVAPENPPALAEAIADIAGDPARAERMGRAAAASGQSDASWSRVAELTLAAYAEHLG